MNQDHHSTGDPTMQAAASRSVNIVLARFHNATDNKPKPETIPWAELVPALLQHDEREDKDGPLFSPTIYHQDAKRGNAGVKGLTAYVADLDHVRDWGRLVYPLSAYEYVLYSTWRYTPDDPRYRVVLLFSGQVPAEDWPDIWQRVNMALFHGENDPATKDLARIHFFPSCQPGALRVAIHNDGQLLDPYTLPKVASSTGHKPAPAVEERIPDGQRHNTLVSIAGTMRRRGMNADEIDAALQAINANRCDPPGSPESIRAIAESIAQYPSENVAWPIHATAEPLDRLPSINAEIQDLRIITAEAWAALESANKPAYLFRHGGIPSRLERDDTGTPVVRDLTPDRLRHELARVANWYTERTSKDETIRKPAKPPMDVVRDLLASPDVPLPSLGRVTEVPVFAPNGALQTTPGYHAEGRTYYAPAAGVTIENIPERPTVEDIAKAKVLVLDELLGDFPFVSDADRANAVALFLLPYARDLIDGPTPNHLAEAPTAGSGKGLLVDVLLRPAIGYHIGVVAEARDDDEWRKRITARLREGRSVILIDNVTHPLDSGVLAAALTALTWEDRILGKSETISVPVRCAWVTTANNPTMTTEIARRCVRIRLDPRVDRPWLREGFKHPELRDWVDEKRSSLIWAALTLTRAWLTAGKPIPAVKPLGSYERWTSVIGGILEVAGIHGFLANLDEFYEASDIEGTIWRQFIATWWEQFRENEVGTKELFPLAAESDCFDLGKGNPRAQKITFGKQLGRQRDRVIGDYRIVAAGTVQRASRWKLLPTKGLLFDDDDSEK